tara:strand:+ start:165 stop:575 length:411 start_codon:yes stop_codon:yes gene_type:complete
MKKIHFLGFIIWLLASFFGFKLVTFLLYWFNSIGIAFKIIIILITAFIILIGIYKILLAFFLLVNKNHKNFNRISTTFSILGLIGLTSAYLYFGIDFEINYNKIFDQSLTLTFGFFLAIILINGFVFFPKSLKKKQ